MSRLRHFLRLRPLGGFNPFYSPTYALAHYAGEGVRKTREQLLSEWNDA